MYPKEYDIGPREAKELTTLTLILTQKSNVIEVTSLRSGVTKDPGTYLFVNKYL